MDTSREQHRRVRTLARSSVPPLSGSGERFALISGPHRSRHRGGGRSPGQRDIAYWDDEGYLYICDRKSDMVISGGVNIYPAEIEAVLVAHDAIADAAVFGIPDDEWGEAVHAVISTYDGAPVADDEVQAFCRDHLAGYKVPRSFELMDEIPRSASGKILKRQLRDPHWAGRTSRVG